ncbi:MAG: hypothetical protein A3B13_02230 [Candidatus Liptonbacteria bacterium RIFCSPLOWO2_01_FULL_45_15]|uniref:Uncharacterized protein n=1 Tax=Candidatus Liptonbacteria bacterium RIFCSPLOWO2_01_FULL_45_15 TaxID=1798649 RepID=A0A1G2CCU7_9BACT|nr:MAG: hypothetical protein A3B13_02230 [Candidatus Liptonbacteria bacterium RIFCSPLOWO2_01_FULL_45_15]
MIREELTNVDIVLYALYLLKGATKKVPTETIAIKSFELARSRFSWRLYPKYPDIEAVRIALFDARKEKNGALVVGRYGKATGKKISDGWIFSPKGIIWIEENTQRLSRLLEAKPIVSKRTEVDKMLHGYENTTAFRQFLKVGTCENIKPYEFTDFLNASLDTPPSVLRDRINKVRALAASGKRAKLLEFIDKCESNFASLLKN